MEDYPKSLIKMVNWSKDGKLEGKAGWVGAGIGEKAMKVYISYCFWTMWMYYLFKKVLRHKYFITHSFIRYLRRIWGESGCEISYKFLIIAMIACISKASLLKRNTKDFIGFRWLSLWHLGKTRWHNLETRVDPNTAAADICWIHTCSYILC